MLTEGAVRPAAPQPPPFPPPGVRLEAAFPVELGAELGPEVLMLWGFLHSFSDILGLSPASVDAVLAAVALGERRFAFTSLSDCFVGAGFRSLCHFWAATLGLSLFNSHEGGKEGPVRSQVTLCAQTVVSMQRP